MNRQFNTASITCPCCGHVFGEQAYFQTFEVKVAGWIGAKIAPPATPGYDVYESPHFPGKTFQVKYSQAYGHPKSKKKYPPLSWAWTVKRLDPVHPDFFVLFGINPDGLENCFLISRDDFIQYASLGKDGWHHMNVSAKEESNRRYSYIPKIWRYVVRSPEINLVDAISSYAPKTQESMFFETHKNKIDEIRRLHESGISQTAIGKQFSISQTSVGRLLRGKR